MSRFVRELIQQMQPYAAPPEGRRDKVRLDFNEKTLGLSGSWDGGLDSTLLTTYPEYDDFLAQLADYFGVSPDCLLLTNGSAEALFLIPFTFIEPNQDTAVISTPTFPVIPESLKLVQARLREVPVQSDLTYDLMGLEAALAQEAKLCILASPDNPTGAVLDPTQMIRWCEQFPETLFISDEAYFEFHGETVLPWVPRLDNLLVTRSFSKAWGLAGLRLGVVIGPPTLVAELKKVRAPYSVNAFAVSMAQQVLPLSDEILAQTKATMARKARVIAQLQQRRAIVIPGAANFFLLNLEKEAPAFCTFCAAQGVLLRDRSNLPGMAGLVRVSIGTDAEMEMFLDCFDQFNERNRV